MTPKLSALIKDLASDFGPIVKEIEGKLATTQHHYADYGALLAKLSNGNKVNAKIFSLALIEAGANPKGVNSGFSLFC